MKLPWRCWSARIPLRGCAERLNWAFAIWMLANAPRLILTTFSKRCASVMRKRNREVWWSSLSRQDLEEISRYLYKVAPRDSAEKLIHGILDAGESLAFRALLWPVRYDVSPDIRSVLVRPYSVFYRVFDFEVEIVRILHGHRNIEAVLRTMARRRL